MKYRITIVSAVVVNNNGGIRLTDRTKLENCGPEEFNEQEAVK